MVNRAPKAIVAGKALDNVDCYVLDDGRRVVSWTGLQAVFGDLEGRLGHVADRGTCGLLAFHPLNGGPVEQGLDTALANRLFAEIDESAGAGEDPGTAKIRHQLRCLAATGLYALVDDATGYQDIDGFSGRRRYQCDDESPQRLMN